MAREQVGGAQVPAVAFKEWCELLGHTCKLFSAFPGYLSDDIPHPVWRLNNASELDDFDAVFFSTFGDFDFENMTVPFTFMVHAEFDINDGNQLLINKTSKLPLCKFVTVIGLDYWGFEKQKLWYPCCMPEYLIDGTEEAQKNKNGLLYAARISSWKNLDILARLSNDEKFKSFAGEIKVFGAANKSQYYDLVMSNKPDFTIDNSVFSVYDVEQIKERNSQFKYFWDVNGTTEYKIELKRVNLACVEAIKFGCIPIVDFNTIPEFMKHFCIDISDVENGISSYADYIDKDYKNHISFMFEQMKNSQYSKQRVSSMIHNIITGLKS
jgi:hypothetical protein